VDDVDAMERMVVADPFAGALIQGLKGVRKARFRIGNRGKSGGGRVIYYIVVANNEVIMLMAYAKAEKHDLSPDDRKGVLRVLEELSK
jgi:mRNA-degrading endonuclease RelE of RelBE toxin-antitoxin system